MNQLEIIFSDNYYYDPNYKINEKNYKFLKIESSQESETEEENSFEYTNYHSKYKNNLKGKNVFLVIFSH